MRMRFDEDLVGLLGSEVSVEVWYYYLRGSECIYDNRSEATVICLMLMM